MRTSLSTLLSTAATLVCLAEAVPWGFPWSGSQAPKAVGRHFQINGKVQYFAGTNSWWLGHLFEDADVQAAVQEIAASDLKVTRVWGFGNSNVMDNTTVYYQLINEVCSVVIGYAIEEVID